MYFVVVTFFVVCLVAIYISTFFMIIAKESILSLHCTALLAAHKSVITALAFGPALLVSWAMDVRRMRFALVLTPR